MRPGSFILKKIAIIGSTLNKLNDKVYTIPILSLISLFIFLLTIKKGYFIAWGDSESYISAGGEAFNVFRTPIYPNLIYFSKLIFGEKFYLSAVVIFQLIVFNISAIYMIKLGKILEYNGSVIFLIFMMYTCSIYVIYTIPFILTESLGISMSVFFVYNLIENLNRYSLKSLCTLSLLTLIMIFLRPIFSLIIPVLVCLILFYILKRKYILAFWNTFFILTIIGCYLFYANRIQGKSGIFSISVVTVINKGRIIDNNYLHDFNAPLIKNLDTDIESENDITGKLIKKHGYLKANEYFNSIIYSKKYIDNRIQEFFKISINDYYLTTILLSRNSTLKTILEFIRVPFILFYFVILFVLALIAKQIIRNRLFHFNMIFLLIYCVAFFILVLFGADHDYGRLLAPTWPVFFIFIGAIIDFFIKFFSASV